MKMDSVDISLMTTPAASSNPTNGAGASGLYKVLGPDTTQQSPYHNQTLVNVTEESYGFSQFEFYQTEQLIFLIVLFVFIMVSNLSVLVAILLSKNRKSRMNFFIMQLAIADVLTGLFSVLTDIIWKATVQWYAFNIGCKLVRFMMAVVTYGSTYVLVALSIDRLDAIARPMHFTGSGLRAKVLVCMAWLFAVLFSVPMLFLNKQMKFDGMTQCGMEMPQPWHWKLNITIHAMLVFVIPTIIIACCYTVIVVIIWSKSSTLHVQQKSTFRFSSKFGSKRATSHNGVLEKQSSMAKNSSSTSSRGLIPKARVKTIKMTFVIVLVFVICWSPYIVFDLLDTYGFFPTTQEKIAIAIFFNSLGPLNSAANPVIYCLFSTKICNNWRRVSWVNWLLKTFTCCQNKESSDNTSNNTHGPKTSLSSEYTLVDSRTTSFHTSARMSSAKDRSREIHTHATNAPGSVARGGGKSAAESNSIMTGHTSVHVVGDGCGGGISGSVQPSTTPYVKGENCSSNVRRTSATPFVRSKLSNDENAILMRNLHAGNGS